MDLTNKIEPGTEKELDEVGARVFDFNKQIVPEFIGKTREQCLEHIGYLIKNDGKAVAGISGGVMLNNLLNINDLFVDDNFRNQGFASSLLTRIETEAKTRGCYSAYLSTLNPEAVAFYTKRGYQIYAKLDDVPRRGVTDFFLKKNL